MSLGRRCRRCLHLCCHLRDSECRRVAPFAVGCRIEYQRGQAEDVNRTGETFGQLSLTPRLCLIIPPARQNPKSTHLHQQHSLGDSREPAPPIVKMAPPEAHHLFNAPIPSHSFSADHSTLAVARDNYVELYQRAGNKFQLADELKGHDKLVTGVDIGLKSGKIVTCSQGSYFTNLRAA